MAGVVFFSPSLALPRADYESFEIGPVPPYGRAICGPNQRVPTASLSAFFAHSPNFRLNLPPPHLARLPRSRWRRPALDRLIWPSAEAMAAAMRELIGSAGTNRTATPAMFAPDVVGHFALFPSCSV